MGHECHPEGGDEGSCDYHQLINGPSGQWSNPPNAPDGQHRPHDDIGVEDTHPPWSVAGDRRDDDSHEGKGGHGHQVQLPFDPSQYPVE